MPNDRQIALLIWLGVIAGVAVAYPTTRSSLKGVVAAALHTKIAVPVLALAAYVVGLVYVGSRLRLWVPQLATDTGFWFCGTALVLLFGIERVTKSDHFFRDTAFGTLGVSALAEFIVNDLFVFDLPTELILLPVLSLLVIVSIVAGHDANLVQVKRLIDTLLGVVGVGLIACVGYRMHSDWQAIEWALAARNFVLPVWLLLGVLPFIYLVAMYAGYEVAYMFIDFGAAEGHSRWRAKLALFLRINLRLRNLGAFNGCWGRNLAAAGSFREAWVEADKYWASRHAG
ncbi:MAG: hypothetical protein DCC49_09020 [Acidobacteria bacterium]|nr:MAG: hypothetical protein DCC49_09020 [Acidobacteriota bacterium]